MLKISQNLTNPLHRVAPVVALLVLVFLCADAAASTPGEGVAADSALAMFLLGLAIGVPAGIGMFFAYLVMRERHQVEEPDELDALLEALDSNEESLQDPWTPPSRNSGFQFGRDAAFREAEEEPIETLEPWERPADWWQDSDD